MRAAYVLAAQSLPAYSHKFSRHDFALAQLFACLAVKELLKRSYRGAEEVLRDSPGWLKDVGLRRAPDHNTLCRAADDLLRARRVRRVLDKVAEWAAVGRILGLSAKPLAVDSTAYESHHVSRHYERRCHQTRKRMRAKEEEKGRKSTRSDTVKRLPKPGPGVAAHCHLVLSAWVGTGGGSDHPHFKPVVSDARRRVRHRSFKVVADAGYDAEPHHEWCRGDMGLGSLIPPDIGRPRKDGGPPGGKWRARMKRTMATKESRKRSGYTSRRQAETVNSRMKRNLGRALAGRSAWSRKRDMLLKTLTHDIMILAHALSWGRDRTLLTPFPSPLPTSPPRPDKPPRSYSWRKSSRPPPRPSSSTAL